MKFSRDNPRPGPGRPKGAINKRSLLVKDVLETHGINLVDQILKLLPELSSDLQVKALIALLPYAYPRLTAIEIKTNENERPLKDISDSDLNTILVGKDDEPTY